MVNGVFQQRLYREPWYECAHRQAVDVPAHPQTIAEAQLLYPLVDRCDFQLLLQRDPVLRAAQVGAHQVGEILDSFLGAGRIGSRQRCDGVQAVEKKMWADQRLQGTDARLRFEHDAAAPFTGNVEVAHGEGDDDRADRNRPGQEAGMGIADDDDIAESPCQLPGAFCDDNTQQEEQQERNDERLSLAETLDPGSEPAQ